MRRRGEAERSGRGELGVCVGGGGCAGRPGEGVCWRRSRRTISGGCRMWGTIPGVREVPPIPNQQKSRVKTVAWWGAEAAKIAVPHTLPRQHWWAGPGWRGDSSKALEAWVPASWGSPRPQQGWASLGAPFPPPGAVSVQRSPRDPGIAGSPDGNPAFDRSCPERLSP